MKNYSIFIMTLFFSMFGKGQTKCTLIFENGVNVVPKSIEGGIQIELPEEYTFYVFGDRKIINIEELDSFDSFKEKEKELLEKNKKILFQKLCGSDFGCGDTEISYEIKNSKMFKYCNVIYFYYENFFSTNSIIDGWYNMEDGDYTIVIVSKDNVIFQENISLKSGKLMNK